MKCMQILIACLLYLLICHSELVFRFLVQDLMEADLHQIIRSQQSLSEQHFQFFIYQICKGMFCFRESACSFHFSSLLARYRPQIRPFSQRASQRLETWKFAC